ncbi:LysR family transcriptional regulator [Actinoplanes sp. N902-109]|nr:LysR family transcriptional regulator [Actinoplanes sp. N902-109]
MVHHRGLVGGVEEASAAEVEAVFATNVSGLLNVVRAVLPQMRAQRAGRVVTIGSMGGFAQVPGWGVYGATTFAVEGLSEAMAGELAPLGITVTVVEPGSFRTDTRSPPRPWTACCGTEPGSARILIRLAWHRHLRLVKSRHAEKTYRPAHRRRGRRARPAGGRRPDHPAGPRAPGGHAAGLRARAVLTAGGHARRPPVPDPARRPAAERSADQRRPGHRQAGDVPAFGLRVPADRLGALGRPHTVALPVLPGGLTVRTIEPRRDGLRVVVEGRDVTADLGAGHPPGALPRCPS